MFLVATRALQRHACKARNCFFLSAGGSIVDRNWYYPKCNVNVAVEHLDV
jgi:hypothetical protein